MTLKANLLLTVQNLMIVLSLISINNGGGY